MPDMLGAAESSISPEGYYPGPRQRVFFGPGSISHLARVLNELGVSRSLIVTSVPNFPVVEAVRNAAAPIEMAIFDGVEIHAPRQSARDAFEIFRESGADSVIAVGGGSSVDAARGVLMLAATGDDFSAIARVPHLDPARILPFITVTTTLSQAEFSVLVGITNETTGEKEIFEDPGFMPACAFLDADATVHTPQRLWLGSGVKAMDRAITRYLSYSDEQVFLDGTLLHGIQMLYSLLPKSRREPDNVVVRQRLQLACWQGFAEHLLPVDQTVSAATPWVRFGSVARHQLGGRYRALHGELSGVLLPAVLKFNRAETWRRQQRIAEALGKQSPEELSEDLLPSFVTSLGLPNRLGDLGVGIDSTGLPKVVDAMISEEPTFGLRRQEMIAVLNGLL